MSDYYYDLCVDDDDNNIEVGWIDRGELNDNLFAKITDPCMGVTVVGYLVNLDVSWSSGWESKMAQDNIDDKIPWASVLQTGGLGQVLDSDTILAFKGRTHFTKSQTRLVWTDISPIDVSMTLLFVAFKDAKKEVSQPTAYLEKMLAPQIKESLVDSYKDVISSTINSIQAGAIPSSDELDDILGYIPNELDVFPLNKRYNARYILQSVSSADSEMLMDGGGNMVFREVTLSLTSTTSLNKDDILAQT